MTLGRGWILGFSDVAEFVLNVALGLIISSIFSILISGVVAQPIESYAEWAKVEEAVSELEQRRIGTEQAQPRDNQPLREGFLQLVTCLRHAKIVGVWRALETHEQVLLAAILANMVRLLHSFYILSKSSGYDTLLLRSRRGTLVRILQLVGQGLLIFWGVRVALMVNGDIKMLVTNGLAITAVLVIWDLPYYWWVTRSDQPKTKEEKRIITAFNRWCFVDLFASLAFVGSMVWFRDSFCMALFGSEFVRGDAVAAGDGRLIVTSVTALVLSLIWLMDYIANLKFYFYRPLTGASDREESRWVAKENKTTESLTIESSGGLLVHYERADSE